MSQKAEIAESAQISGLDRDSPWSPSQRVLFRFAFIYFGCFIALYSNGTIFSYIPVVGTWVDTARTWPTNKLSEIVSQHIFHLTGLAANWHPTGSGDTAMDWIENGLFLVYAIVGCVVWTAAARRLEYSTLNAWLRFALRLTCGFFMLAYGMIKLFPLQMRDVSIAVLNEPLGNTSPMTMLWSLLGLSPVYQSLCGAAEVVGGLLLLYRRTALLGSLFSALVMANVVLYDFSFDTPVKLFSTTLLVALLFLVLPDAHALLSFFWRHEPATPKAPWFPPLKNGWARKTIVALEVGFGLACIIILGSLNLKLWITNRQIAHIQSQLLGAWKLDDGQILNGAFITGNGLPATNLYVDTIGRGYLRSTDGALWRTYLDVDTKAQTVEIWDFPVPALTYTWQFEGADRLLLSSKVAKGSQSFPQTIRMTRVPVATHYPLLETGFHWVSEWPLER